MRIVMPLFDFFNESRQEFEFGDGAYSLRRFVPAVDLPAEELPGLSQMDRAYIEKERWALVAEDPDPKAYKEDINLLLLSFKIHTLGRLFIKYRLCKEDTSLCSVILERMNYILGEKSPRQVTLRQLQEINVGFERLREMDAVDTASNRTHNAIYFMYGAYFASGHVLYLFMLLFTVLEALFSKDISGSATETICKGLAHFSIQGRVAPIRISRGFTIFAPNWFTGGESFPRPAKILLMRMSSSLL